jgi:hypothetical protein
MTKLASPLSLALAALVCVVLNAVPAQAQNTRSWVSGNGSDGNPCTRTLPCLSFLIAHAKTNAGGIINCVDAGDFGPVTISKAITIDCTGTFGGISQVSGTVPVDISASATDVVRIRGLAMESHGLAGYGVIVRQVGALHIEQCKISGATINGVDMAVPTGFGSELYVSDSLISENGLSGIGISATGSATARISLSNVKLDNNVSGLVVVTNSGSTGRISLSMRDSTTAGNSQNGILIQAQGAPLVTALDSVTATTNSTGLLVDGAATRVLITRLTAIGNFIGMSTTNSGVVVSYGDNHINNNISMNGTPTVVQTPQ